MTSARRLLKLGLLAALTVQGIPLLSQTAAAPDQPSRAHTGKLIGVVTDKAGKPSEGATVTLTDNSTREELSTTSNGSGRYEFSDLFPGAYTVQAKNSSQKSDAVQTKVTSHSTTVNLQLTHE
jgi:hypothetical protein